MKHQDHLSPHSLSLECTHDALELAFYYTLNHFAQKGQISDQAITGHIIFL